jgi:hypothetical protein
MSGPSHNDKTVQWLCPSISDLLVFLKYGINYSSTKFLVSTNNMLQDVISVQYILLTPSAAQLSSVTLSLGSKAGIVKRETLGRFALTAIQQMLQLPLEPHV